jgi:hypothetical protein
VRITAVVNAPRTCAGDTPSGNWRRSATSARRCGAFAAFGRRIGGKLEPRREPGQQAAERFQVRDGPAVGARRLFHRHPRLERAVGQVREHRIGEAPHNRDPRVAIARCRVQPLGGRGPGRRGAGPGGCGAGGSQESATANSHRGGTIEATTDEYHSP